MRHHQLRHVPWLYDSELALVHGLIYGAAGRNDECASMQRGIDIILSWMARSARVPPAIQLTATLASCVLMEREETSEQTLQMVFAYAVIRFVNLLVDPEQTKFMAMPVSSIAAELGIPSFLVALRHSATHEREMPPLTVLRRAVAVGLDWLNGNYWSNVLTAFADSLPLVDSLRLMIANYKQNSNQLLSAKAAHDAAEDPSDEDLIAKKQNFSTLNGNQKVILNEICEILVSDSSLSFESIEVLAAVLLEPGYLIPKDDRSKQTFSSAGVPSRRLSIWLPLLKRLSNLDVNILLDIVATFCANLHEKSPGSNPIFSKTDTATKCTVECTNAWVHAILKIALEERNNGAVFDSQSIIRIAKACLISVNKLTESVFRLLDNEGCISADILAFKEKWQAVFAAPPSLQRISESEIHASEFHTINDYVQVAEEASNAAQNDSGAWQQVFMTHSHPFGILPNGNVTFLGDDKSFRRDFSSPVNAVNDEEEVVDTLEPEITEMLIDDNGGTALSLLVAAEGDTKAESITHKRARFSIPML